jgi:hypothetical protein
LHKSRQGIGKKNIIGVLGLEYAKEKVDSSPKT